MQQYQLNDAEMRDLATRIATRNVPYPDGTFENWFRKYMEEYSRVMEIMKNYFKSSES